MSSETDVKVAFSNYAEKKINRMKHLVKIPIVKKIYTHQAKQELCKIQLETGGYPVPIMSDNCKHLKTVIKTLNTYLPEENQIKRDRKPSINGEKKFKKVSNLPRFKNQVLLKNNTMETPETILKNCFDKENLICDDYKKNIVDKLNRALMERKYEKELQDKDTLPFSYL